MANYTSNSKGENMETRLKNCPFCGGEVSVSFGIGLSGKTEEGIFECLQCSYRFTFTGNEKDVKTKWNTRNHNSVLDQIVKEVEEIAQESSHTSTTFPFPSVKIRYIKIENLKEIIKKRREG